MRMLKDYFWSLTLVALLLVGYTALVIANRKPPAQPAAQASTVE